MSSPTIDSSHWPYVEITYGNSLSDEDLDDYAMALDKLYAKAYKTPCVIVVDTRLAPTQRATLNVRRRIVGIVNSIDKRYPGAVIAEAVILESEMSVSLYTAYTWLLSDRRVMRRGFRNKPEAQLWAKGLLARTQGQKAQASF